MEENIYKKARLAAAKRNPELSTVEKAHSHLYMSREKLLMIEQTDPTKRQAEPNPYEIKQMAELYEAPELRDYYCTHHCPVRKGSKALIHGNLSEISTGLMSALFFLDNVNSNIHQILADSVISEEEKEEFKNCLKILRNIAYSANSLELWAQKNGFSANDP